MFGMARRRATRHTIEAVSPLVRIQQRLHGLPSDFWGSDFVLGFLGYMVTFHSGVTSGEKLSREDRSRIFSDTFSALSNLDGKFLASEFVKLWASKPRSRKFQTGVDNATLYTSFLKGDENSGHEIIQRAKERATVMGTPVDHGAIGGALLQIVFFEPLRQMFPETEAKPEPSPEPEEKTGGHSLVFKSGKTFFEYQCKFGHTDIVPKRGIVALIDSLDELGIEHPVTVEEDGTQMAALKVASPDGGFVNFGRTPTANGDRLKPGDVVIWVPVEYREPPTALQVGDDRIGWVGFIVAKVKPEIDVSKPDFDIICYYDR